MKRFISKQVYNTLFKKAGLKFPENHSYKRDILDFVEYQTIWKEQYLLLKNGVKFQYLIRQRLSKQMQQMYIDNDFKPPYSMYSYFFYMTDSSIMCNKCFEREINMVNGDFYNVNFKCEGLEANYEDSSLYCDFCNERIEESYPKDKE